jgi:hypothetical protein
MVILGENAVVMTSPVFGQDPTHAAWIGPRLTGHWGHVTGTVPAGFDAYARILHPVTAEDGRHIRWSEIADATGTQTHPLVQWDRMARRDSGRHHWWDTNGPEEGNLVPHTLQQLLSVLRQHTTAAEDCWFCLWNGYGWIHGSPSVVTMVFEADGGFSQRGVPPAFPVDWMNPALEVRLPHRGYLLGRGSLDAALGIGSQISDDWFDPQSPNLFWPDDRAWCVATEIDFDSTLVGGPNQLIKDLLATPELEAWPVGPGDSLQEDADHIN